MSGEPFEPGETAIWQNLEGLDEVCNGQECIVLTGMIWFVGVDRYDETPSPGLYYEVRDEEGEWLAAPWELKKKRPPEIPAKERRAVTVSEQS